MFSPTFEHILLAYGRRHSSLLKSIVINGEISLPVYTVLKSSFDDSEVGRSDDDDRDGSAADFETEMLDRFYGGGFWRSTSQKEA
ncbi:hypothetical protein RHMOL_Rhmol01G0273000 [Rhododendron molle]|uniref:Uncharacterized protein n=1 Tax=Rhododendron molle TaxID=49168 RepID=A0ACC0Q5R7_RHOML|nr:hypothetical protein RHMOL_Rhmol01G0273000 [Rhododendron molle]